MRYSLSPRRVTEAPRRSKARTRPVATSLTLAVRNLSTPNASFMERKDALFPFPGQGRWRRQEEIAYGFFARQGNILIGRHSQGGQVPATASWNGAGCGRRTPDVVGRVVRPTNSGQWLAAVVVGSAPAGKTMRIPPVQQAAAIRAPAAHRVPALE